ncbi:MAG TPA: peptidoglycan-binding domain-containing protein [Flavobacteriales bacterium]|nr:peptidoglycan-binding domain-containing protein [Flavobacteriales bacterium]
MATGNELLKIARKHIGERYILGALAPKDNPNWKGPWDCAEFVSWVVYQAIGELHGCARNNGKPASADAYTGYWARDAKKTLQRIPVAEALRTPGAILLRVPAPGLIGHIAFSDGVGGTLEAHSSKYGVIEGGTKGRRWDMGLLIPGITYATRTDPVETGPPPQILRLTKPRMKGKNVKTVQQALKNTGFDPGPIDGDFGPKTASAVAAFQLTKGLVPDGEVGPATARSLKIKLV